MLRRRRGSRSVRSSSNRRRNNWLRASTQFGTTTVLAGTGSVFSDWVREPAEVVASGTDNIVEEDLTLVRCRNDIHLGVQFAAGDHALCYATAGLIVWEKNDANLLSVAETPRPWFDGDADWLWHWTQGFNNTAAGAMDLFVGNDIGHEKLQWTKAMRKLSSRQGLLFVCEFSNGSLVTVKWNMFYYFRGLFKWP